jgi:hypothetical protein
MNRTISEVPSANFELLIPALYTRSTDDPAAGTADVLLRAAGHFLFFCLRAALRFAKCLLLFRFSCFPATSSSENRQPSKTTRSEWV